MPMCRRVFSDDVCSSIDSRGSDSKRHRTGMVRRVGAVRHRVYGIVFIMKMPATTFDEALGERRQRVVRRMMVVLRQHDDSAEEASVNALANMVRMIVERPGSHHFVGNIKAIRPCLSWAYLVRAASVSGLGAEWPRSVGVDSVP